MTSQSGELEGLAESHRKILTFAGILPDGVAFAVAKGRIAGHSENAAFATAAKDTPARAPLRQRALKRPCHLEILS